MRHVNRGNQNLVSIAYNVHTISQKITRNL